MPSPQKRRTLSFGRISVAVATAVAAIATPLILQIAPAATTVGAAATPVPVPAVRALPVAMDVAQQYQGQSICDPVEKPGIKALKKVLKRTYGKHIMYTTRACAADPTSEHTEGRALDWMVSLRVASERVQAQAMLRWLIAKGPDGTPGANARRMGIMYMAWNNQIWSAYSPIGWRELKGCAAKSKSALSWDTYCHRNHIHFSLTWEGAAAKTSYWDGTAQTEPPCPSPWQTGSAPANVRNLVTVNVRESKVFDTTTGRGNGRRVCRLQEDRWTGDSQRLEVKVAGKGGIPKAGAARAILKITAVDPNAPMNITAWPTGGRQPRKPTLVTTMNTPTTVLANVRIGARGTISLATRTGDTNLRVSVVGYQKAA